MCMVNEVILVGRLDSIESEKNNKTEIILSIERPFNDVEGRKWDSFNCKLWSSIFKRVILNCKVGDLLAIKGRLSNENSKYTIMAENVVILNKSKDNILKKE